jgi:hypothetical protein
MLDRRSVAGEFDRVQRGKLYVRGVDKHIVTIALTNLVPSDLEYVCSIMPPEIDVKFKKSITPGELPPDARQDDIEEITVTVEVKKTSKMPFNGVLKGELYLIGKEVATEHYRLFSKKIFSIYFPDPNNNVFTIQHQDELFTFDEYDTRKRGALYDGYILAIYGVDGTLMELETNYSWAKKEEPFKLLRAMTVPAYFFEDCRERAVPRPDPTQREYMDK